MGLSFFRVLSASALLVTSRALASDFDPTPWVADLEQARQAFHQKYANWDWVETEREVKIDSLFDDSAVRLRRATNEHEAKAVFDRIVSKLGDGHVEFDWREPAPPANGAAPVAASDLCGRLGYDPRQNAPGPTQDLPGYVPLSANENPVAAGIVVSSHLKVGVLRVGVFQPQGFPELCRAGIHELAIAEDKPCDDECQDKISGWAYDRLNVAVEERLRQLKAAGARALLVDIANNGGGSEWAEAVARMLTPKRLISERRGFVRGEHWTKQWRDLGNKLRSFATTASAADRTRILGWAAEADAALVQAETPCLVSSAQCQRIAKAGYSTGLVRAARAGAFRGKAWADDIFSPSQYHYHDGVWDGPLIVLVDQNTWSAAEEFAAVLQDNRTAVIMGARTGGAGCGHTNGGTPTMLTNSRAILELSDCVRLRSDDSNEVRGVVPDVVVAIRGDDGSKFRARLIAAKLPRAIALAKSLQR